MYNPALLKDNELGLAAARCAVIDTAQVLHRHFAGAQPRRIAAGHRLWSDGDGRRHVFLIRSGALCLSRLLPDGRRVVIGFAYPGDLIGLGGETHGFDADAIQDCRLDAMALPAFQRAAMADPALARVARNEVSHALSAALEHMIVVTRLTAAERLAHFLTDLAERGRRRGNGAASVVLPMRRLDIADYLGLTIETVSRTFTAFRNAGLIAMDQPSVVSLKRLDRLAAMASGDAIPGEMSKAA